MRLLIISALLVGCVPKKKYVELEAELASVKTKMDDTVQARDQDIASLQATVSRLEAEEQALTQKVKGKERMLTEQEAMLAEMRKTNAAVLKDKGRLSVEVAAMQDALRELQLRKAAADERLRAYQDLLDRFKTLIDSGKLQVKIQDGRMVVALATDVLFASGSASLSEDGRAALTEVASVLSTIPDREFQVEGHTDNVPISTSQFPNNWYLASARALNVVEHLTTSGMSATKLSGASFGEHRPVVANDTKELKAMNRRIEIVVVPDLSQLPGYDELEQLKQ